MTGLSITLYRPDHGDCTNGGATAPQNAKGKTFVVFDKLIKHGNWDLDECMAKPDRFVCLKVVRRHLFGGTYMHLEPMTPCNGQRIGYMDGGNLGYTSDSRFNDVAQYPLPIHDRSETQEDYNRLSR